MIYNYSLTVPAARPETNPAVKTMLLSYGIVYQVELGFPPGCAALVHVSIWHLEHQVWPTNPDESFAWDDYTIRFTSEEVGLITPPYVMELRAWSEDASYPHTVVCRLGMKKPQPQRVGSWLGRILTGSEVAD